MRRFALLVLAPFVVAAPAMAQGFEGTVTMKISASAGTAAGPQSGEMTVKMMMKGDMSATVATLAAGSGPMAGAEVRMITDHKTNTMTTLTPLPAGVQLPAAMTGGVDAKGIKIVVDLSKAQQGAGQMSAPPSDIKKLGTSETIAGLSCDDYESTSASGTTTRMCLTSALGAFTYPQMGGGMMGRRGGGAGPAAAPGWSSALAGKPQFPLKVWTTDGKVAMEVTAIDKSPVDASVFAIPDGYVTMPGRGGLK